MDSQQGCAAAAVVRGYAQAIERGVIGLPGLLVAGLMATGIVLASLQERAAPETTSGPPGDSRSSFTAASSAAGNLELPRHLQMTAVISKPKLNSEEWSALPGADLDPRLVRWVDGQQRRWRPHQVETAEWRHPTGRPWNPEMYRGSLWRTTLPGGQELYLLEMRPILMHTICYWLFLRDPGSGALSPSPTILNGRWMREAASRTCPHVRLRDLDGDGNEEVLFTSREHNGTVYSADQDHYFEIGPSLSLVPVLTLDTWQNDPGYSRSGNGFVIRSLVRLSSRHLKMLVWRHDPQVMKERASVGWVDLQRKTLLTPWQPVGRKALESRYTWAMNVIFP